MPVLHSCSLLWPLWTRERAPAVWFEWGVSAGKVEGAACGVAELVDGEVPW